MPSIRPIILSPVAFPVFCVGRDKPLLQARLDALAEAGIVAHAMNPEEAEEFAREPQPRVWVLCHSIELGTLVFLAGCVRRHSPQSRLVLAEGKHATGLAASLFHRVISASDGTETLARQVHEMAA